MNAVCLFVSKKVTFLINQNRAKILKSKTNKNEMNTLSEMISRNSNIGWLLLVSSYEMINCFLANHVISVAFIMFFCFFVMPLLKIFVFNNFIEQTLFAFA